MTEESVVRGAVFLVSLGGAEKSRPVVVVQCAPANRFAPQAIVAAVRENAPAGLPVHVPVPRGSAGLAHDCVVDCGFLATIPKDLLVRRLGRLSGEQLRRIDEALRKSLGLN